MFAPGIGKHLRVHETLVERRIDARDVHSRNGFQPALGLEAIERMALISGKRVAVKFQIMQKLIERGARGGSQFLASLVDSEKDAAVIPARKGARNAATVKRM